MPAVNEGNGYSSEKFSAQVHQATGMVAVQAGCGFSDALLLMIARADSSGITLDALAACVLDRSVRFDED